MVGFSAAVPAVHPGEDPVTASVGELQRQAFNSFEITHVY